MEIGKTLYVVTRQEWRNWLSINHNKESEIWLIYYKKSSNKPRIPYNDAVEEAICFGWIDSIVKSIDDEKFTQRFTPRRPKSNLSEANKERIRRLIAQNKMTEYGLAAINHIQEDFTKNVNLDIAPDILKALKEDEMVWKHFQDFPESYKTIRIGWIEEARSRPDTFNQRLNYFIKITARNKKYGMIQ